MLGVPDSSGLAGACRACKTTPTIAGLLKRMSKPAAPALRIMSLCSGLGAWPSSRSLNMAASPTIVVTSGTYTCAGGGGSCLQMKWQNHQECGQYPGVVSTFSTMSPYFLLHAQRHCFKNCHVMTFLWKADDAIGFTCTAALHAVECVSNANRSHKGCVACQHMPKLSMQLCGKQPKHSPEIAGDVRSYLQSNLGSAASDGQKHSLRGRPPNTVWPFMRSQHSKAPLRILFKSHHCIHDVDIHTCSCITHTASQ